MPNKPTIIHNHLTIHWLYNTYLRIQGMNYSQTQDHLIDYQFDWLNSLYGLLFTRGRTNSRHDQDASGNLCAEARPKMTDSIQCGGPDIKVDRLFYIHCAVFSISTKSLWKMSSKNCCLIDHLATNRHFPVNKTENIEEFWQARHTRYPSWQGFSLLVPPLL